MPPAAMYCPINVGADEIANISVCSKFTGTTFLGDSFSYADILFRSNYIVQQVEYFAAKLEQSFHFSNDGDDNVIWKRRLRNRKAENSNHNSKHNLNNHNNKNDNNNNNNNDIDCTNKNNNSRRSNCSHSSDCCCCLCSLSGQIRLHQMATTHQCERSNASESDGKTCNLCLTRLLACSKTNETNKTAKCCFAKCKKWLRRGSLKRHYVGHMRPKQQQKKPRVECPVCTVTYSCKASLAKHSRKHLKD